MSDLSPSHDRLGTARRSVSLEPFVVVGAAVCAGAVASVVSAPPAAAVTVGVLCLWRAGARLLAIVCAVVFFVAGTRASLASHLHERARIAAIRAGPWPARCAFTGEVVRSPVVVGDAMRVDVRVHESARDSPCAPRDARVGLAVPREIAPPLVRGDRVAVVAQLAPPYRFANDGAADPRPLEARRAAVLSGGAEDVVILARGRGPSAWIDRARARLRTRIDATFPNDTAGMARALVLGEDAVAAPDQRAFRKSGLAHLLAVSGMHLVLVVAGFVALLRALLVRIERIGARIDAMRVAAAAGIPVAWAYCELAGSSGSAVRAAWMASIVLAAHVLARRPDAWRAFGLSVVGMVVIDPLATFDLSFVLSALATLGLLALARPIAKGIAARLPFVPDIVVKPVATTVAATIACAPVLAVMAPDMPVGGVLANVIAVPAGELAALPLCLLHALLSPWPAAERGCAVAASGALSIVRAIARFFAATAVPVPAPTHAQLGAIAAAVAGAALSPKRKTFVVAGVVAVVCFEIAGRARGSPHGVLRATFIDVGQGDASLVDFPDGAAILIDGGGLVGSPVDVGERAVAPMLRARRRSKVDVVVLTHPHPDHYLGLVAALEHVSVGELWDTGQGEADGAGPAYANVLAMMRARGAAVRRPRDLCGVHAFGGATIEVLAPCPTVVPDRSANDSSFVLRLRFGARSFLFTGDAEHVEEGDLLRDPGRVRADVLKVGHHGSRTSSTPAFLTAVSPEVAVVSCGVRNRFGHPHPTTLAALAATGARVLRTDRHGAVIVTSDGRGLEVRTEIE